MKLARKRKAASAKSGPSAAISRQESPEWVKQMHSYFQQNGSYRAEDLQRVLGDSRESVRTETTANSQLGACLIVVK